MREEADGEEADGGVGLFAGRKVVESSGAAVARGETKRGEIG
jgi:hypothetical protein